LGRRKRRRRLLLWQLCSALPKVRHLYAVIKALLSGIVIAAASEIAKRAPPSVVSCLSLSRTTLNYAAGGRGRLCGLTVAAVSVVMLAAEPSFLSFVPRFLPGGLLLYLGLSLIFRWLVDSARRLSWLEYGSLLAIALLIIEAGFIAGVLTGVLIGCVTFAVSASCVNAIKFSFDGSEYHSSLDRGPEELAIILAANGQEIQGLRLQDYLFFGSAHRLYQHVKTLLANQPECRFLIFGSDL
jgi:SulP family sulfate permease